MKPHGWPAAIVAAGWILVFAPPMARGAALTPPAAAEVRLTPAYLSELAEEMRTNHPALRALAARTSAARHAVGGVRGWDDPLFKFGGVVATEQGPRLEEEGNLVYELEQKIPVFGQPRAERRMALREVEVASARDEMQFQYYRRDLAKLLFSAAAAETSLAIGRRDLEWLETMAATAGERSRAGTGSATEWLRLRNEQAKRADRLKTEASMRDHTWASIHRLLGRPLVAEFPRLALPDLWPELRQGSRLADYAQKFEPGLRAMSREIEVAEARVAVTRSARRPEVMVGIEGRQDGGSGNFREGRFSVGLSLPWLNWRQYREDESRDRARLEAARFERANEAQRVEEEVHGLLVTIDAARREAVLYRDEILPRSRQVMELAHANWIAGRGMFMETMEARRMILEAELMLARAVAEQHSALSELVVCCGIGDLESLETISEKP